MAGPAFISSVSVRYSFDLNDTDEKSGGINNSAWPGKSASLPAGMQESRNRVPRDELLNGEIFYSLKEAKILIEQWRQHYNTVRQHSSLDYRHHLRHRPRSHHNPV
jgi:transposase InsO family protein